MGIWATPKALRARKGKAADLGFKPNRITRLA